MSYHQKMENRETSQKSEYKEIISHTLGSSSSKERISVSEHCARLKEELTKATEAYIAQHGDKRFAVCSAYIDITCSSWK